jgi:hypothetical protein
MILVTLPTFNGSLCIDPSRFQGSHIGEYRPSGPVQGTREWGQR